MGILYTVSLPWCSITLYHIEWVNMILNYSFLCHSHFFIFLRTFVFLFVKCATTTLKKETSQHLFGVDFYKNDIFGVSEKGYWKVASEGGDYFCLFDQSSQIKHINVFQNKSENIWAFQIVSSDFFRILILLPKIVWVKDPLAKWKQADHLA